MLGDVCALNTKKYSCTFACVGGGWLVVVGGWWLVGGGWWCCIIGIHTWTVWLVGWVVGVFSLVGVVGAG
jgi:hypothetical protein